MALSCPKVDGEIARARQRERLKAKITILLDDAGRAEQRLASSRAAARGSRPRKTGPSIVRCQAKVARWLLRQEGQARPCKSGDLTMRDWHRELTDWLIERGGIGFSPGSQRLAAEHFKVHPSWISMLTNTDAFQGLLPPTNETLEAA
jgi:hypothetical protein